MKHYYLLLFLLSGLFLAMFGLVTWLDIPLLEDPRPLLQGGGWLAAGVGVGLLVVDLFIPVPSSLIMIAHGAVFGIFKGALLSLLGTLGATCLGFYLGRRGGGWLDWIVPPAERRRAERLLLRWGGLAILVTRPITILAESVAILAGTSPLSWSHMILATLAGTLPAAVLYAMTGALAAGLDNMLLIFALVLAVAGLFWLVGKRIEARGTGASSK